MDEAGDPTLFNRRKQVVVGREGCSKFFCLGLLEVASPEQLARELTELRVRILADPYFKDVPSMLPAQGKTAIALHAKDDLPEVRRDVFNLLLRHELRFFATVRDKRCLVENVRDKNLRAPEYRYHPNQLYDSTVSRLFRDRLHKEDSYRIVFARRGASDRTRALMQSLQNARKNFRRKWGIAAAPPIEVEASDPAREPCLQAADYLLWALQRLFERREARYWDFVWPRVSLVHDVDDTGRAAYGTYYNRQNPLTLAALEQRKPGI